MNTLGVYNTKYAEFSNDGGATTGFDITQPDSLYSSGSFSVSFWLKDFNTADGSQEFINWSNITAFRCFNIGTALYLQVGGVTKSFSFNKTGFTGNIVISVISDSLFVYQNNIKIYSSSGNVFTFSGLNPLKLGRTAICGLDEICIFSKGLTADERASIVGDGLPQNIDSPKNISSLLHYWRMGDGDLFSTNWTFYDDVGGADATASGLARSGVKQYQVISPYKIEVGYNYEVPLLFGAEYDYYLNPRASLTTAGAVVKESEIAIGKPLLSNFRIEDGEGNKLFFDSSSSIAGIDTTGFVIGGNTISDVTVDVDELGGYFTVDTAFTYWDNVLIRLGENTDTEDSQSTLHNFTLSYVENNISEPTTTDTLFVASNAVGGGVGSISDPFTFSEAVSFSIADHPGTMFWIKNGEYQNTTNNFYGAVAKIDSPMVFAGYNSLDLNGDPIAITENAVDSFTNYATDESIVIDSSIYPVFNGAENSSQTALVVSSSEYLIFKDIQISGFGGGVTVLDYTSPSSYQSKGIVFENVTVRDAISCFSTQSDTLAIGNENSHLRFSKCLAIDGDGFGIDMSGNYGAIIDCKVYSGIALKPTDYYMSIRPQGYFCSIVRGESHRENNIPHGGRNTLKSSHKTSVNNCLISGTKAYNLLWGAISIGEEFSYDNVAKDNYCVNIDQTDQYTSVMQCVNSAHGNIFERNYGNNLKNGIIIGNDDNDSAVKSGDNNIFRNNIIANCENIIYLYASSPTVGTWEYSINNLNIYNNSFSYFTGFFYSYFHTVNDSIITSINLTNMSVKNNIFNTFTNTGNMYDNWRLPVTHQYDWFKDMSYSDYKKPGGIGNLDISVLPSY